MTDPNPAPAPAPAPAPVAPPTDPNKGAIPSHIPPADPQPSYPDLNTIVPAEYKDREYLKDVKDVPGVFKKLDNAVTTLGKRPTGIPHDNADPKEWDAFNKSFGVPEKADDYQLGNPPEGLPKDENFQKGVKGIFHKAGVSARQAKILEKEWNDMMLQTLKASGVAVEKQDADFTKLAGEVFGDRQEKALGDAKILLAKYAPEKVKPHLESLSNENLILMAGVLDGIRREYINEDDLTGGPAASAAMSSEEKRVKGKELMASKAYSDPFHPDHNKTVEEVQRLYGTAAPARK